MLWSNFLNLRIGQQLSFSFLWTVASIGNTIIYMKICGWGLTDKGKKRSGNQDSFLVDDELSLYIVADGMGVHKGGEVASQMAVSAARDVYIDYVQSGSDKSPRELIQEMYTRASHDIYDRGEKVQKLKGMGTTMVVVLKVNEHFYIGNVGDSRVYLQKDLGLWQVTEDHSLVYEQLREGIIKESQLDQVEGKNIITRSVGYERDVQCDIFEREIKPGDRYILCSDGLTGMVSDSRINEICICSSPEEWPERMVIEANVAGGDDNVTVLSISIDGEVQAY